MTIEDFYKDKKVFVTGHTGFKGSWLCEMLLAVGADVYGYALEPPTVPSLFSLLGLDDRMHSETGDIRDFWHLYAHYLEVEPDIVFHMAAQPIVRESYRKPRETYETNAMGTVNLLDAVRKHPCARSVVNVTTDKVYRNDGRSVGYIEDAILDGFDPYSNSKSCSELATGCYNRSFFDDMNIAVSTVRAGNVIGGGDFAKDRIIPDAFRALESEERLTIRNPSHVRPFWHVADACYAYILLAMRQYEDKSFACCYNVGPGGDEVWTVEKLIDRYVHEIEKKTGKQMEIVFGNRKEPHEDASLLLNSRLFSKNLSWQPRWNTEYAVRKTAEWYGEYVNGGDCRQVLREQVGEFVEKDAILDSGRA